jgi:hypothetical protein
MPKIRVFLILLFGFFPAFAFGRGKTEEPEKTVHNSEWILCVTGFDMSALPENRRMLGEVMTRSLTAAVNAVEHRIRVSREYAYYEGYAWSQARQTAARALSAKRDERDLLIYRGEPEWKYKRSLKTVDEDIVKLAEELAEIEAEMPQVAREPVFKFTEGNISGTFPPPPAAGGEYRFCQSQKADGFLAGELVEYHGRLYITIRLYAVYTRSFIYADSIIFSPDDVQAAVDEIAGRLVAALAGSSPAVIAIQPEPGDTLVLINESFAGRGEIAPREHPPGKVTVSLSADGYVPQTVETELAAGEITEIKAELRPLELAQVDITVPGETGVLVYLGARYVGEAPLTLRLPVNQFNYVQVEKPGPVTGRQVFQAPGDSDKSMSLSLKTKIPFPAGQKRVERARRHYYWAWGGTWISGAAAWMAYGLFNTYNNAYRSTPSGINPSAELYHQTLNLYYVYIGALALVGAVAVYDIFQLTRYLYIAGQDAVPIKR